jgi:hypothetical protein
MLKTIKIRSYEMGLHFRDGEFKGLLGAGRHWFFDPLGKVKVEVVSQRSPWLAHEKLDVIVKSGALKDRAVVLDLKDYQRAHPTLMRLRELEVLERVATSGKLNVVLGEKGLAERVVNLLSWNLMPGGREQTSPPGVFISTPSCLASTPSVPWPGRAGVMPRKALMLAVRAWSFLCPVLPLLNLAALYSPPERRWSPRRPGGPGPPILP